MGWVVVHPDPLVIFLALLLDLIVGDPHCIPHPVVAIGKMIKVLDNTLRRDWLNERLAGILLLSIVLFSTAAATFCILKLLSEVYYLLGWFAALLVSSSCLASRSLHKESARVVSALLTGDLPTARLYLSYIVGRDTDQLEEAEIWRAVVETVAENTSDGVIAPMFWLAIGGPVAAMAYKASSTLDSMVGYRNDRYIKFGWASAKMDDLLNYIPARISALLFVIAAPLSGCSAIAAMRIIFRDRLKHSSPNSGHPESAAAGALGVRLGGPSSYGGKYSLKEYIGDNLQPLDERTYRGMIKLMYISTLLMAGISILAVYCMRGIHVPFI